VPAVAGRVRDDAVLSIKLISIGGFYRLSKSAVVIRWTLVDVGLRLRTFI